MTDRVPEAPHAEILACIAFYDAKGWDWMVVVAFLSARASGMWPLPPGSYISDNHGNGNRRKP